MPEPADPMTDRLTRFTPNAAGLDRDAILFAAGRQSVRSSRIWAGLAGLLAVSQAVTLLVLWPRSPEAVPPVPPSPPAVQSSPDLSEPPASPPPDVWSAGSRPEVVLTESAPVSGEFVSSGPTLTVGSGLRFD